MKIVIRNIFFSALKFKLYVLGLYPTLMWIKKNILYICICYVTILYYNIYTCYFLYNFA